MFGPVVLMFSKSHWSLIMIFRRKHSLTSCFLLSLFPSVIERTTSIALADPEGSEGKELRLMSVFPCSCFQSIAQNIYSLLPLTMSAYYVTLVSLVPFYASPLLMVKFS